jgi:beta-lactamase superfamily II metal-dependent hydrolase
MRERVVSLLIIILLFLALENRRMKYEYEILKVDDADVIFIRHYDEEDNPYVVLIDAGNVGDWETIKDHLQLYYETTVIDLAVCTHPDKDHIGGFFGLLDDAEITISEFWLIDPANYLDANDIKYYRTKEGAMNAVRQIFDKPSDDTQNLIDILLEQNIDTHSVSSGYQHSVIPLKVVGPNSDYYSEVVKDMVGNYVEPYEWGDTTDYDEAAQVSEDEAKGVIDEDDDESPNNKSSIILLYEPKKGEKILFTGDATCASLSQMLKDYPEIKDISLLKVPHHGSKHNLSSKIIDVLKPQKSYISAKGTRKHPSSAIVNYLSKYGHVYSTHKCTGFIHSSNGISRPNTKTIQPFKTKQNV